MIEVSKRQFFDVINPLDVHPCPIRGNLKRTEWKLRNGHIVGICQDSETYPISTQYWLEESRINPG